MATLQLTDFTSYDEVRAVLGVSNEEITDETLSLKLYYRQLVEQFHGVSPNLETLYTTTKAVPEVDKTSMQKRLVLVVEVFSAYAIAKILLTSIPLFAPKKITDGRAEVERVADPFEFLRAEVNLYYDDYLRKLKALAEQAELPVTAGGIRLFSITSPIAVNQVTG